MRCALNGCATTATQKITNQKHIYYYNFTVAFIFHCQVHSFNYSGSLKLLCKLKNPIDQFFKDVMVNAEDESLKMNRLALLEKLYSAMNLVADLSKLSS